MIRGHSIPVICGQSVPFLTPFKLWTLERLQSAFKERQGVHLSDSTIWTWLDEEGLKWKRQQSWFHEAEKHDVEFVEKRGASFRRM